MINLAAGIRRSSHPVTLREVPVEIHSDTVRSGNADRVLPPESVRSPGVLVTVRIGQRNDVPLELSNISATSTLPSQIW